MKNRGVLTQGGARSSLTLGYNHVIPTGFQFAAKKFQFGRSSRKR